MHSKNWSPKFCDLLQRRQRDSEPRALTSRFRHFPRMFLACGMLLCSSSMRAQEQSAAGAPNSSEALQQILQRLDTLEKQNQSLLQEIQQLRDLVKSEQPPTQAPENDEDTRERVDVNSARVAEQAETKVGSSQRFPLTLTGMLLFDAFRAGGNPSPGFLESYSDYSATEPGGGATLRQSIIGLEFQGPHIFGDGQIHGSFSMDFWATSGRDDVFRIRRGTISFEWKRRTITVGQDKTLIAPFAPESFARVGIPPLSGAGNLWLWRPQIRYEERVPLTQFTQLKLQGSLFQTDESSALGYPSGTTYIEPSRPAFQARVELAHQWSDTSKFSAGIAAHESYSHVAGQSIPSRVISADFLYRPVRILEITGTIFHGENFSNVGGIPPGISLLGQAIIPIHGSAGWMQISVPVTTRLTFNLYGGRQLNRAQDLTPYDISRTLDYAGNALYRLGPNVVLGFEGSREEAEYLNRQAFAGNRYDATVAYLF